MHRYLLLIAALCLSVAASSAEIVQVDDISLHTRWLQNETSGLDLDHNETDITEGEDHYDEGHAHEEEGHVDEHEEDHDHADHDETTSDSSLLEDSTSTTSKPWGEAILASFLINIVTLVGVFFLSGEFVAKRVFKRDISQSPYYLAFTRNVIPSFACGALLATTVFLVLPEALYLISAHFASADVHAAHRLLEEEGTEEGNAEGQATWRFGACIIAGFLLPIVTSSLFPHNHEEAVPASDIASLEKEETEKLGRAPEDEVDSEDPQEIESNSNVLENNVNGDAGTNKSLVSVDDSEIVVVVGDKVLPHAIDWSLAASIMAGDFFHNFADGIFVGTAFLMCSTDLAIAISAATIYHEIAQEVADYFMLTRFCHIPPCQALCFNFVNGLSVMFGACLILGIEDMTDVAIGCILAVSGGVYIYISVAECYPRAKAAQHTTNDKLVALLSFIFGVVPIGLVLLNHGHCDDHGGHAH